MNRLSIRWRLTLWYGSVLTAVLVVFGSSVYLMMRHVLLGRTGAGMSMEATEVAEEVARARDRSTLGTWLQRRFARHPGYDIQVSTPEGQAIFRSDRIREPRQLGAPLIARQAQRRPRRGPGGVRIRARFVDLTEEGNAVCDAHGLRACVAHHEKA